MVYRLLMVILTSKIFVGGEWSIDPFRPLRWMFSWRLWMTFTWKTWLSYPVKTCIKKRAQMEWLGHGSCGSKMDDMGTFSTGDRGESQNLSSVFSATSAAAAMFFAKPQAIKSSIYSPEIQRLEPQNHAISQIEHPFPGVQTNRFAAVRSFGGVSFRRPLCRIGRCTYHLPLPKPRAKRVLGEFFGDVAWPSLQKIWRSYIFHQMNVAHHGNMALSALRAFFANVLQHLYSSRLQQQRRCFDSDKDV